MTRSKLKFDVILDIQFTGQFVGHDDGVKDSTKKEVDYELEKCAT